MGDIHPKGKVVKEKAGVRQTLMDNGTRDSLSMSIDPQTLTGAGSGKTHSSISSAIDALNKKLPGIRK